VFTLAGQSFGAMESAHTQQFTFHEAISLLVDSKDENRPVLGEPLGRARGGADRLAHRGVSPDEEVRHRCSAAGVRRSASIG
jgi:hypothetical protein